MTTGKTIALSRWTFVGGIMSLLFNTLSRLVITFLPRSKHLLISTVSQSIKLHSLCHTVVSHQLSILHMVIHIWGFSGGSDSKSICLQCERPRFDPWVGKIPWRRKWQPTPVLLPVKSHRRRAWWTAVHGVAKSQTQLSDFTSIYICQC